MALARHDRLDAPCGAVVRCALRANAPYVLVLLLCACSGPVGEAPSTANPAAGCVDDSKHCIEKRQAALKSMLADPKRAWVRAPESPAGYATGVKFFAYRQVKGQLTCAELAHGREETRLVVGALKQGSVPGANDSRIAQVKDMAGQLNKELAREFDRVCKSPTEAKAGFEARAPKG
jgi:hypothetical protein